MPSSRYRSPLLKIEKLKSRLLFFKRVIVAFSGGVDSTFLLYFAKKILGRENVLAVVAESPTYPVEEVRSAIELASNLGVRCQIIRTEELEDENFVCNSKDRCYFCKKELFSKLKQMARENAINYILDGSNFDDLSDYRPGNFAKKEFGVCSPLQEVGLTKDEIRQLSKEAGLPTWDKPSMACLSSRIPYGIRITREILCQVGEAEKFIRALGFRQVRVRHHDKLARIEVEKSEISKFFDKTLREKVTKKLEKLGYYFVTLDLNGYTTGSLNKGLSDEFSV